MLSESVLRDRHPDATGTQRCWCAWGSSSCRHGRDAQAGWWRRWRPLWPWQSGPAGFLLPRIYGELREEPRPDDGPEREIHRLGGCLCCTVCVAMAFAPLLLAGIADDLVRGLHIAAYGGAYSKATPVSVSNTHFADKFKSWRTDVPLVATLLWRPGQRPG